MEGSALCSIFRHCTVSTQETNNAWPPLASSDPRVAHLRLTAVGVNSQSKRLCNIVLERIALRGAPIDSISSFHTFISLS